MDLVLGLSIASTAVRWVLVDGTTGEGAPIDREVCDIPVDVNALLDKLLDRPETASIHAIGVAWTRDAEEVAGSVLAALSDRGLDNVVAVSEVEAADALATGIADIAGYDDVAVCVVEPDAAVVAMVDTNGVNVERIGRPLDGDDAVELTSSLLTVLDLNERRPDAIFVLGSVNLDLIVASLAATASSPVISAAEADFALARGIALAAAQAVNTLDCPATTPRWRSRIGTLTSVLVAAVVAFVISVSAALGLRFVPHNERANAANAVGPPVAVPTSVEPAPPRAPLLAKPETPAPQAPPAVAKTMVVAAPPAPAAPVAVPAQAAPPPVFVPPAPPVQLPPPPQPRLRDRILEHIPIIGRFHQPQPYPSP